MYCGKIKQALGKVVHSIDRDVMWKILDMYGLPEKFIRIIKQSYGGFLCCVRTTEGISPWFNVTTGVRQGCIWSTLLFNIVIDWILKKTHLINPRNVKSNSNIDKTDDTRGT